MSVIKRSTRAEEDLIDIWFFIAIEHQERLSADRYLRKMEEVIQMLASNPGIGTRQDHYRPGLYKFPFRSYLIFYFRIENGIEIVRVLHGARNISGQL